MWLVGLPFGHGSNHQQWHYSLLQHRNGHRRSGSPFRAVSNRTDVDHELRYCLCFRKSDEPVGDHPGGDARRGGDRCGIQRITHFVDGQGNVARPIIPGIERIVEGDIVRAAYPSLGSTESPDRFVKERRGGVQPFSQRQCRFRQGGWRRSFRCCRALDIKVLRNEHKDDHYHYDNGDERAQNQGGTFCACLHPVKLYPVNRINLRKFCCVNGI